MYRERERERKRESSVESSPIYGFCRIKVNLVDSKDLTGNYSSQAGAGESERAEAGARH